MPFTIKLRNQFIKIYIKKYLHINIRSLEYMIKEIIIKIRIYDKKKLYYDIYEKNYLRFNFNQFLRHMHA